MKIAFFLASISQTGGMERVTSVIANELAKNNSITLINMYGSLESPFFLNKDINIISLIPNKEPFRKGYINKFRRLRSVLKKEEYDILVTVDSYLSFLTFPASLGIDIKRIYWEHFNSTVDFGRKTRHFARKLSSMGDLVITLTERDKEYYKSMFNSKRVISIPNPVPFDVEEDKHCNLHSKKALAVGRFNYQKGFDLLVEIWGMVCTEIDDWTLTIVGDGEEKEVVEKLIRDKDLSSRIELPGKTSNISQYYNSSALFLMSSRFEGLPMVLIESKFFGLPAISFDCETGPKEIINNGIDGYLIENGNLRAMADKIIEVINNDTLNKMSCEAKKGSSKYLISEIVTKWESTLKGLFI